MLCRVLCNLLLVLCKYDYLQTYRYTNVLFPHAERGHEVEMMMTTMMMWVGVIRSGQAQAGGR